MKDGICYIVGAGEEDGVIFAPQPKDCVIAADGGFAYLVARGIRVDLAVGDFDSLPHRPEGVPVVPLERDKDETDMFAAARIGIDRGYACFHIHCGMGGRIDHTMANMQLLAFLSQRGMRALLFGRDCVLTALTNGILALGAHHRGYVSVFSHAERSTGVFLRGLKYRLDDATVSNTFPIGVSNEFTGKPSVITVEKGTLLIVLPRGEASFGL